MVIVIVVVVSFNSAMMTSSVCMCIRLYMRVHGIMRVFIGRAYGGVEVTESVVAGGGGGRHAASRYNSNQPDFLNEPHVSRRFRRRSPINPFRSPFSFSPHRRTTTKVRGDFPNAFSPPGANTTTHATKDHHPGIYTTLGPVFPWDSIWGMPTQNF